MSFIENIKERAKMDKKTIILPESMDSRVIEAASHITQPVLQLFSIESLLMIILLCSRQLGHPLPFVRDTITADHSHPHVQHFQ